MKLLKIASKRGLALLVTLMMCLSLLPGVASAAYDVDLGTVYAEVGQLKTFFLGNGREYTKSDYLNAYSIQIANKSILDIATYGDTGDSYWGAYDNSLWFGFRATQEGSITLQFDYGQYRKDHYTLKVVFSTTKFSDKVDMTEGDTEPVQYEPYIEGRPVSSISSATVVSSDPEIVSVSNAVINGKEIDYDLKAQKAGTATVTLTYNCYGLSGNYPDGELVYGNRPVVYTMYVTVKEDPTQNTYTLTLDPNNGTTGRSITVEQSSNTFYLGDVDEIDREGYDHVGWSESPSGKAQYALDGVYTITNGYTATLYAVWCNHSNVKYTNNGNGTHTGTCPDCGKTTVTNEPHVDVDQDNECDKCKADLTPAPTCTCPATDHHCDCEACKNGCDHDACKGPECVDKNQDGKCDVCGECQHEKGPDGYCKDPDCTHGSDCECGGKDTTTPPVKEQVSYDVTLEYYLGSVAGEPFDRYTVEQELSGEEGNVITGADLAAAHTNWATWKNVMTYGLTPTAIQFQYVESAPESITLDKDGSNTITLKYVHTCDDADDDGKCDDCGQAVECTHKKDENGYCTVEGCKHGDDCCQKAHNHVDVDKNGICDDPNCNHCMHDHAEGVECPDHWTADGKQLCDNANCQKPGHRHVDKDDDGKCDECGQIVCTHKEDKETGNCTVDGCGHTDECCRKVPKMTISKEYVGGKPTLNTETGVLSGSYRVTVTNKSGYSLYGLEIEDTLTSNVTGKVSESTFTVDKLTLNGQPVSTNTVKSDITLDGADTRTWEVLSRNEKLEDDATLVLEYTVEIQFVKEGKISYHLKNIASYETYKTPGTSATGGGSSSQIPEPFQRMPLIASSVIARDDDKITGSAGTDTDKDTGSTGGNTSNTGNTEGSSSLETEGSYDWGTSTETPDPEPTPDPTPDPEPTPDPTPDPEPTPDPTPDPEPTPDPTPDPEPTPDTPSTPETPSFPSPSTPDTPSTPGNTGSTGNTSSTPAPAAPADNGEEIEDENPPLAGIAGLNKGEHFAYITGYGDGTVRPMANISRAEVATIFFRLMTDDYRSLNWSTASGFADVKNGDWFNNAIATSAKAGLVKGYPDGSFAPNANITRAEFATIAARFLGDEVTGSKVGDFADTANHWAASDIRRVAEAGWMTGDGNNFRPDEPITRAEVMVVINRMLDRVPDADHLLGEMTVWSDNAQDAWYYADVQEATNSHAYDRNEQGVSEIWTAIEAIRDWAALEKAWVANGGAAE